ncbi:MAG TPA: hypothetical protein VMV86_00275 [Methanosarcinales archaeon]|nr:hypothetical protein [Methanosarcinales archaeon]
MFIDNRVKLALAGALCPYCDCDVLTNGSFTRLRDGVVEFNVECIKCKNRLRICYKPVTIELQSGRYKHGRDEFYDAIPDRVDQLVKHDLVTINTTI